jgi:hypothetical protein
MGTGLGVRQTRLYFHPFTTYFAIGNYFAAKLALG